VTKKLKNRKLYIYYSEEVRVCLAQGACTYTGLVDAGSKKYVQVRFLPATSCSAREKDSYIHLCLIIWKPCSVIRVLSSLKNRGTTTTTTKCISGSKRRFQSSALPLPFRLSACRTDISLILTTVTIGHGTRCTGGVNLQNRTQYHRRRV
jgi:hypothetical protein